MKILHSIVGILGLLLRAVRSSKWSHTTMHFDALDSTWPSDHLSCLDVLTTFEPFRAVPPFTISYVRLQKKWGVKNHPGQDVRRYSAHITTASTSTGATISPKIEAREWCAWWELKRSLFLAYSTLTNRYFIPSRRMFISFQRPSLHLIRVCTFDATVRSYHYDQHNVRRSDWSSQIKS